MSLRFVATSVALGWLTLSTSAFADDVKLGTLKIDNAWARATAPSADTGAVYLEIDNDGTTPEKLIAADSPVAAKTELHGHTFENGVARMRPVEAIEIAPDSDLKLAPGALHLMLLGLKQPLTQGTTFPLTLTFNKAGTATVQVHVQAPADTEPQQHHHAP